MILTVHQYRDRVEAGHVLARRLAHYASRIDTLVLALPPGGVPIAAQVAAYLNAPLDALVVRKLTVPGHPDIALGAIASGGVHVFDDQAIRENEISAQEVAAITCRELAVLENCEKLYRGNRRPPQITGRVVIVVDEGLTTGFAMHAAVIALHRKQPAWLVVAAPVGSNEACEELAQEVHEVVCPLRPDPFQSVGLWYEHFSPTDDEEVRGALRSGDGLAQG